MKSKLFLVLLIIFLIAIIYDTLQMFKYGIANSSIRFLLSYVTSIGGFFSSYFFYNHYKNKEA